ncbi:MAG: hypothetical protein HXY22_00215 [Alphaproteobacteria bacterium]|nr:hypothetical protein [Alphaproteobacteria bacterium]
MTVAVTGAAYVGFLHPEGARAETLQSRLLNACLANAADAASGEACACAAQKTAAWNKEDQDLFKDQMTLATSADAEQAAGLARLSEKYGQPAEQLQARADALTIELADFMIVCTPGAQ